MARKVAENQRQRAPSQRSLQTRARILDAAEQAFARQGFDGASIRDIAALAGVQGALVSHHGGNKEALFETVVARRAEDLSQRRLAALEQAADQDLRAILAAFLTPFLALMEDGDPGWRAYARLIAHVSADDRWRDLAARCFDPTAQRFIGAIAKTLPETPRDRIGAGFVFMVSAMLSLSTAGWRIGALAGDGAGADTGNAHSALLDYCTAGFLALTRD